MITSEVHIESEEYSDFWAGSVIPKVFESLIRTPNGGETEEVSSPINMQ
jgi:hypothetical protein